jgi:hypothetical protein
MKLGNFLKVNKNPFGTFFVVMIFSRHEDDATRENEAEDFFKSASCWRKRAFFGPLGRRKKEAN